MTPEVATIVVAVLGLAGITVQTLRSRGKTWQETVREELELWEKMPEGPARDGFLKYIEHKITERTEAALVRRQDPWTIGLGLVFMAIGVSGSVVILSAGGWWNLLHIVTVATFLFGLIGFWDGMRKVERDEKGRAVTAGSATGEVKTTGDAIGQAPKMDEPDDHRSAQ